MENLNAAIIPVECIGNFRRPFFCWYSRMNILLFLFTVSCLGLTLSTIIIRTSLPGSLFTPFVLWEMGTPLLSGCISISLKWKKKWNQYLGRAASVWGLFLLTFLSHYLASQTTWILEKNKHKRGEVNRWGRSACWWWPWWPRQYQYPQTIMACLESENYLQTENNKT